MFLIFLKERPRARGASLGKHSEHIKALLVLDHIRILRTVALAKQHSDCCYFFINSKKALSTFSCERYCRKVAPVGQPVREYFA